MEVTTKKYTSHDALLSDRQRRIELALRATEDRRLVRLLGRAWWKEFFRLRQTQKEVMSK